MKSTLSALDPLSIPAASLAFQSPAAGPRSVPLPRLLRSYWSETRYECLRTFRTPAFTLPFLLLPVALYLFFGALLFGAAVRSDPKLGISVFVAWGIFGVMGPALFGFGIYVATERENGLLRLKRSQPMPPGAYLLAKGALSLLFSAVIAATLIAGALLVTHPQLSLARMLAVSAVEVLGSLPFCALGLFLGTRLSAKAAPGLINLVYLPMLYLSGFLFPLPKSIQAIVLVSPAFHLDQLALSAAGLPSFGGAFGHVLFLTLFTVLLGGSSLRRLARQSL